MDNLTIFEFETQSIRVIDNDGEPWFVLKDVCEVLGLAETHRVAARLDSDEKADRTLMTVSSNGVQQTREMTIVNEAGLYKVILRSDKPDAKAFKRWVTHDVLPDIRRHGVYMTENVAERAISDPDWMIQLLTDYKRGKEERAKLKAENIKLTYENADLEIQLDENKEYYSIKRVAKLNGLDWRTISWRALKDTSNFLEYEVKKAFDANYGNVNAYHIEAWRHEYPHLKFS
jgi:prophage antirepressor-like protein